MKTLLISDQPLCLDDLRQIWKQAVKIEFDEKCWKRVEESCQTVERVLASGETVYGVNTGFGLLANTRIDDEQLGQLQTNLVLSHSTGVGEFLEEGIVRLILICKIYSLSRGFSGVSVKTLQSLISLVNHQAMPCIPAKGSVGASGDLAPLAHMSACLLGHGFMTVNGECVAAQEALDQLGLQKIELGPKEGLALMNGTQVSTALALHGLFQAERIMASAVVTGALSTEAIMGSDTPFDDRIHQLRGQKGQIKLAALYRKLMSGSEIRASHLQCDRVQDPYCIRCQPQVMGAIWQQINHAASVLLTEANAVTDNPLVFSDPDQILSGGNFHAEPVALVADQLAVAIAEIGSIAERRIALLVDPHMSGLPAFLIAKPGLNSGFMIAHVTAAALASENKMLSHPGSVDSLPTSANQEDHVSMATHSARRLSEMTDNVAQIISIEWLSASQGLEFRRPLKSSPVLEAAHARLREKVKSLDEDRFLATDIQLARTMIEKDVLSNLCECQLH
ncbi:MAG: histidine ammonia-lyase [bacterium]